VLIPVKIQNATGSNLGQETGYLDKRTSVVFLSSYSVVGIATSYGLDDQGVGVRVPVGSRMFSSPDRPDRL
jgi:hypothetical protein